MLSVSNLMVVRGGRTLFSGLTFDLCRGSMVVLQGRNGSGKTTLLDCISGTYKPHLGTIVRNTRRMARLPQGRVGFWNLTVSESIRVSSPALSDAGHLIESDGPTSDRLAEIAAYLESTRLDQCKDKKVCQLSGGELQRLKFAQVLATSSDLLLLDEPFNDLDASTVDLECHLLSRFLESAAVVLVTHVLPHQLCKGRVISIESPTSGSKTADPIEPKANSAAAGYAGNG